ncbi:MAG: hypothetical protein PVI89_16135 [Desulfobacteraceae bacterium]|jgi:hypothetical protein
MKFRLTLVLLWLLAGVNPVAGQTDIPVDFVEQLSTGSINWTSGSVTASGIGLVDSAIRNVLETAFQVRMNADCRVIDLTRPNVNLQIEVEEMASAAEIIGQKTLPDGRTEMTVKMELFGGFAQLLLPTDIKQVESIKPLSQAQEMPTKGIGASAGHRSGAEPDTYTGLIVDARGIGAKPAMVPVLLDENGKEVYSSAFVSREYAVQQGVCLYMRILGDSANLTRVAPKPLWVKGLRTRTAASCDIVISNADASRLRGASSHLSFLKQCRVIILMD